MLAAWPIDGGKIHDKSIRSELCVFCKIKTIGGGQKRVLQIGPHKNLFCLVKQCEKVTELLKMTQRERKREK